MHVPTDHAAATDAPLQPYRWAMLAGTWLIYYCFGLVASGLAPLVVPIEHDLGLSHSQMGTVFAAWTLTFIFTAMPCGALMDRIGPRRSLVLSALFIATSALLRGIADGYVSLLLAVAVFGIGGPLVSIGSPKLISLWFGGRERAIAMGIYTTGPALGMVTGLSLTNSVMMPLFDGEWRYVLFVHAGFVLVCGLVWLAISAHPDSRDMERRLAAEPRQGQLSVFAGLMRVPAIQVCLAMGLCFFFFNHGLNNWMPELLRHGGMDPAAAGLWAAIPMVIGVAGALTIPRLATPERRLAILMALFLCITGTTLLLHAEPGMAVMAGLVLQGLSRGTVVPLIILAVVESPQVGPHRAGAASGMFFSAAEVGGVLGPVTLGVTYDATGGFTMALNLLTGICVLLLLLGFLQSRLGR